MMETKEFTVFVSLTSEEEILIKSCSDARVSMLLCINIPSDEPDTCEFNFEHEKGKICQFCLDVVDYRKYELTVEDCAEGIFIESFELSLEEGVVPLYSLSLSCFIKTDELVFLANTQNYLPLFRKFDGKDFHIDLDGKSETWDQLNNKMAQINPE